MVLWVVKRICQQGFNSRRAEVSTSRLRKEVLRFDGSRLDFLNGTRRVWLARVIRPRVGNGREGVYICSLRWLGR